MLRLILLLVLIAFIARAFWRLVDAVIAGMGGKGAVDAPRRPPALSVQMARDPVCGTFVVPERAIAMVDGDRQLYFCSTRCRDAFRASSRGRVKGTA
jgi:YHS domain-containing protein